MPHTLRPQDRILGPGDLYFGFGEQRLRTLLGSCVAVTIWHPRAQIGGMCHFLLPTRSPAVRAVDGPLDGRYADEAMEMFRREMERTDTRPGDYLAKIFGGGHQFPGLADGRRIDVPERNVAAATSLCDTYGLRVVSRHLGLDGSRQVVFDLATGDVWVRHSAPVVEPG